MSLVQATVPCTPPPLFPFPSCTGIALEEASIDTLQTAMANGSVTAVSLLQCYLERIHQTQPWLNAIIQLNPAAHAIARALDAERQQGSVRSALHGIPFLVKDNIASADSLQTTAGSLALLGSKPPRDAHVLAKLRAAGGVLLGKAAMSEWADMRSSNYSEGYSARGGQARSAYNLTVNSGGSSTGCGVGVAVNLAPVAVGTETDGSVINPAQRNAVVGIKPTVGRTSRAGVVPESEHQDTVGVFGKTVRDAVYALDAIWGEDERDNYTLGQPVPSALGGFEGFLANKEALKDARFGIPWDTFWVLADDEQKATLTDLVHLVENAGATVVNHTELPDYQLLVDPAGWNWDFGTTRGFANESEFSYVKVDFYNNIASYLAELNNTNMRTLQDLVDFNYANDGSEGGRPYPGAGIAAFASGQDLFLASLATGGVQDQTYHEALSFCQQTSRRGIDNALGGSEAGRLHALLVPADVAQTTQVAAQAGYPMLTIPAGVHRDSGMPFGLALMQTAWREDELVRWASAVEDLITSRAKSLGLGRSLPEWRGYMQHNIPVLNA